MEIKKITLIEVEIFSFSLYNRQMHKKGAKDVEDLFKKVENDEIRLIHFKLVKDRFSPQNAHIENWDVAYEIEKTRFVYRITIDENLGVLITISNKNLEEQKKDSVKLSKVSERLFNEINNSPLFRLKKMFHSFPIEWYESKYLIFNVEQFQERQKKLYIEKNKHKIKEIITNSLSRSFDPYGENDVFLLIKEKDELPLMDFLLKENYMTKVATFNDEDYLKPQTEKKVNHQMFYKIFAKEMKNLGYNLFYDFNIEETVDRFYDEDDYFYFYPYEEHEELEEYYLNKVKRRRKQ